MPIHIVRLGDARLPGEGLRIGTVRRPPRGVPKTEFASRDFFDVWYPNLAPSAGLMAAGRSAVDAGEWSAFERAYRREMASSDASRTLDLLSALSRQTSFSVGCYCEDESRCHRGILRVLLKERGAEVA